MYWPYTDPMRTLAVLPSRFQASRFPGKPLTSIAGKPMIQWVFEAASRAEGVDRVVVATDDDRIAAAVRGFGGEALMTDPALPSGTDRTAAALDALGESFDCILNIQGDEPATRGQRSRELIKNTVWDCPVSGSARLNGVK